MQKILVVEDDRKLNQALCYALEKQGYEPVPAFSIEEARRLYRELQEKAALHLVIQDVNLPDGEGFAFCKWVKEQGNIPVIFLTARDQEEDALTGYDMGAEDYVTKPFSLKILLRKINLILKRNVAKEKYLFDDGNLRIDAETAKITINEADCGVTPTEFRLLKLFAENKGKLLTYDILLEHLWDSAGTFTDKHTLAVNVNRLRGKIEDQDHKYISNVYGMGYQWIG